jgi:hypothetical protein
LALIQLTFGRFSRFFKGAIIMVEKRDSGLNPSALSVPDAALLLSRAGGWPITDEMLDDDIASSAPTNADGTINLVHYAAWLVKGLGNGDRSAPIATG